MPLYDYRWGKKFRKLTVSSHASKIAELSLELMRKHGFEGWDFCFNGSKTQLGVCYFPPYGSRKGRIELSLPYTDVNSVSKMVDTTKHEIAHAYAGSTAGHGPLWKQYAVMLGTAPVACCYDKDLTNPPAKYKAICKNCCRVYARHRVPLCKPYWCPPCGSVKGPLTFYKVLVH